MTYTGAQKTTQTRQAVFMGHRTQARRKAHYKRIRAAIRTAAGWTTAIMFFLVLGKAGASDCGAPMEEIFPSTFIYMGISIISFYVWEACGGNRPYNNKYNRRVEK